MSLTKTLSLVTFALLVACGGEAPKTEAPKVEAPKVEAPPAAPVAANPGPKGTGVIAPDDGSPAQDLALSTKGDEMLYDVAELKAKAGQNIRIKFKNAATAAGMVHNVIVVPAGKVEAVANASMAAGEANGWSANDNADIIGASALAAPGAETTLLLKALQPGTYEFFCSFPGHYMTMKGKLIVE